MIRHFLIAAGLLAALVSFASFPQAAAQEPHGDSSSMDEAMEQLEDNLRVLRKSMKDEAMVETSLEAVLGMQEAVAQCKHAVPPMAEALEGAPRKEFMKAFRLQFIGLDRDLLTLEEQLLKSEFAKAKETYKLVRKHEDEGHERFTED